MAGGDEIAAPLPLSAQDPLHRVLLRLEVPDCDCKTEVNCRARRPADCPGEDACDVCPSLPCDCPAGADHDFPLPEWAALQRIADPDGYADRPPPPPAVAASREARVSLYMQRARLGYGLHAPGDQDAASLDGVAVQGAKGRAEAGLRGGGAARTPCELALDAERLLRRAGLCAAGELLGFLRRRLTRLDAPDLEELRGPEATRKVLGLCGEFARGRAAAGGKKGGTP